MTEETAFTADEERVLTSLLEEIVPPRADAGLPGAGGLGLTADIDEALRKTPALRPVITQGLSVVTGLVERRSRQGFVDLAEAERSAVLAELAAADEAFLPTLSFLTYVAYYRNARVLQAFGLEPRPPHPKGYEMEPDDPALLEPVRRRPKLYREC
jgi:hypothetical protein